MIVPVVYYKTGEFIYSWIISFIDSEKNQSNSNTTTISNLSIYAQVPEYVAISFTQAFGLLASFEFAYFVAPRSAQSLFMSFNFMSKIVSSYVIYAYMTHFTLDFTVSIKIRSHVFLVLNSADIFSVITLNHGRPTRISTFLVAFRSFS